ncbi:MAG: type IX secretion system membrane protein PorP/SprF [Flavobacteriaceae bacterium]|jgi:type IX secretion system PorP/SprF family membrane protein|nr:type IX secretion system membrane protein PorP/SprF [Flavobacteriaceae bacterium]
MQNKKRTYQLVTVFLLLVGSFLHAQEEYIVNHSKFMQKTNPSYFGFNSLNRTGVLYNQMKLNEFDKMDNKYVFGALSFSSLDFSLGVDVNSFKIQNTGLTINLANLSYVYKLQFDNDLYFLPAVTIGFGSSSVNPENLVFEDQLDTATGFINSESIDPLAPIISNVNYMDLGASFMLHSDKFMAGLTLKHLNRPNTSYNKEVPFEKPIQISVQGAYEFDLNPYERRYLPRYSYLFAYGSFTKFGDSVLIYLSQDFQLGEFSLGLSQQASSLNTFALNNVGVSIGLAVENFDFGVLYNFPFQSPGAVFSPSIFELFVTFDFSIYRRNRRGQYNRLQTDNYY